MSNNQPSSDLKSYLVGDKDGRLKFPSTMPKQRTDLRFYLIGLFMVLLLFSSVHLNNYEDISIEAICYGILICFTVEIAHRLILSAEEFFYHLKPRYGGCLKSLLKSTFFFTYSSLIVFGLCAVLEVYFFMDHGLIAFEEIHHLSFLSIAVFVLLLGKIVKAEVAPIYNSLRFEEDDGLNYSSAMAHSFYYGYLKLILPKTGGEDKNLTEIIEVYSARHQVSVFPKLFILVPKSAVCPVSLEGPNIEESSSLEEKQLTIAGVKKRVYKNTVYKLKDPKKEHLKHYVCAEYATPLRTFGKALESSGRYNENFKNHKNDIVLHFYLITRDLIRNDPEISDLCEMIYFDDRDEKGKFIDVSDMLLKKIKKKSGKKTKSQ